MSYCSLAALKSYLNIPTAQTGDDALLQSMLDSASARIDSRTQRTFWAASDSVRYYDPSSDIISGELWFDGDISHITSIINGDNSNLAGKYYTNPRNVTPWYSAGLLASGNASWEYTNDAQNAIAVTGRWAYMTRSKIATLVRYTNTVTATMSGASPVVGAQISVIGADSAAFDGTFEVLTSVGATVTWAQTGSNASTANGYVLTAPSDIFTACRRLASWLYRQKDNQSGDADRPIVGGDGVIIMPSTIPADVETILRPYARVL